MMGQRLFLVLILISLLLATTSPVALAVSQNWHMTDTDADFLPTWYDSAWGYRKPITIQASQVPANQSGFPVLISETDSDLASKALSSGNDILFTSSNGTTKLAHEIEYYSSGTLVAWVNVLALSSSSNTILYMYYGNSSASNQENVTGTWDSSYRMVQHLEETSGTHYDSTSYGNNGTPNNGVTQTGTGQIDGADEFDGTDDYIECGTTSMPATDAALTFEAWARYTTTPATENLVLINDTSAAAVQLGFRDTAVSVWTWGGTVIATSALPGANVWHHYVFTFDGTTNRLYVDGTETNNTTSAHQSGSAVEVRINTDSWSEDFQGGIDEVRISTGARSADWIETSYNNQSSPSTFYTVGSEESAPSSGPSSLWYDSAWGYRKQITIQASQVTATQSNFPVLISETDSDLASRALSNGDDILFTSSDEVTKIPHEIEYYSSGTLVAWVNVPSLSSSADTVLYMYYGNSSASNQENVTGTWDSDYAMVQHMEETSGDHLDSTSYGNDSDTVAVTQQGTATGQIDGADQFDGTDDYIIIANSADINTSNVPQRTISAWFNCDDVTISSRKQVIWEEGGGQRGLNIYIYDGSLYVGGWDRRSNESNWNPGTWLSTSISSGNWYHVSLWLDGGTTVTADALKGYLNGSEFGSGDGSQVWAHTGDITIGAAGSNTRFHDATDETSGHFFDGTIDEVCVSNTPRTADWIQISYNNQNSPSTFYTTGSEEAPSSPGETVGNKYMTKNFTGGTEGSVVLTGTDDTYWYAEDAVTANLALDNSGWTIGSIWYSTSSGTVGSATLGVFKIDSLGAKTVMATLVYSSLPSGASHAQATGLSLTGSGTTDFSAAAGDRLGFSIAFDDGGSGGSLTIHFNHSTYDTYISSPNTDPGYPVPDAETWIFFAAGLGVIALVFWKFRTSGYKPA